MVKTPRNKSLLVRQAISWQHVSNTSCVIRTGAFRCAAYLLARANFRLSIVRLALRDEMLD